VAVAVSNLLVRVSPGGSVGNLRIEIDLEAILCEMSAP